MSLKRTFLTSLLLALFAVVPFGAGKLAAEPQFDNGAKVENVHWRGGGWGGGWGGRGWYGGGYYRPYSYGYYPYSYYNYYPYRSYYYYNW